MAIILLLRFDGDGTTAGKTQQNSRTIVSKKHNSRLP